MTDPRIEAAAHEIRDGTENWLSLPEARKIAIAALAAADRAAWRPISEAPENEQVLLYCPDRGCPTNRERIELGAASHGWRNGRVSNMSYHSWATHFQPLPAPPTEETD